MSFKQNHQQIRHRLAQEPDHTFESNERQMGEERTRRYQDSKRLARKLGPRPSRSFWVGLTVAVFISALYLLSTPGSFERLRSLSHTFSSRPGCLSEGPAGLALQLQIPWSSRQRSILGHQGPYTPPFLNFTLPPVRYAEPGQEEGEVLAAVIILQRHAARYPTASVLRKISRALDKIERLPLTAFGPDSPGLDAYKTVVKGWAAKAGTLTDGGRRIAYQLGRLYRARYAGLVDDDPEKAIYVRSRGNHRCIESAGYLLEGYANQTFELKHGSRLPRLDHVFPADNVDWRRNPLGGTADLGGEYYRHSEIGEKKAEGYLDTWTPTVLPHLRRALGEVTGRPLEGVDALALMSLCGFETQMSMYREKDPALPWSPWRDLFESLGPDKELELWAAYAYWYDFRKYYTKGPGNAAGAEAGRVWVDDLKERLDGLDRKWTDKYAQSSFKAKKGRTSPRLLIDSSSDNRILLTLNALGLTYRLAEYRQSRLTPFATALIVEVYTSTAGNPRLVYRI